MAALPAAQAEDADMKSMRVHMFRRRAPAVYCLSGDADGWAIPTDAYPGEWFYV